MQWDVPKILFIMGAGALAIGGRKPLRDYLIDMTEQMNQRWQKLNPVLKEHIVDTASKHGIPLEIFKRQLWAENRFRESGTSPMGAIGIAQIVPKAHIQPASGTTIPNAYGWPKMTLAELTAAAKDPYQAITLAAKLDAYLYRRNGGDWAKAMAAYNAGQGNLNKYIAKAGDQWLQVANSETKDYVAKIMFG